MSGINSSLKKTNLYSIEITTTQRCNFRCTYCFENDSELNLSKNLEKDFDLLIRRINDFLNSEWFQNEFTGLEICFWGGEPTINFKMIEDITDIYKDDERVYFFIYSNGTFPKRLFKMFEKLKDRPAPTNVKKFRFQISYDGNPVHDLCRKTISGKPSSKIVLKSIDYLISKGLRTTLKATCPTEYIKYIPDCWNDVSELYEKYKKNIEYSLTLDYHKDMTDKDLKETEEALVKVAKQEYKFFKKHGHFLSNIFDKNKRFCSSGRNMIAVDVDGKVYVCHGAIYSDRKKEFQYTSIYDNDFIKKLKEMYKLIPIPEEKKECEECVSTICLRCNVVKYLHSTKDNFVDKFHDFTDQADQCEYYKINGRIGRALSLLIWGD